MYQRGHGVARDYKEAVRWFRLAVQKGDADAQYELARSYTEGKGVTQDYVKAHMWFNIAASNGVEPAFKGRDLVLKGMTYADLSKAQELARECVAKSYKGC